MTLNELKKLLEKMQSLPKEKTVEPNIFNIGGRGYYENPTSDVLAFFCNSQAPHGLGSLVVEAIFQALDSTLSFNDCSVISEVEREVSTESGKRIDLIVEGNDWVMTIENKIFHDQNNPFQEYQTYVEKRFKEKTPIYMVLSPQGNAPKGWLALSYQDLIHSLKERIADTFLSQPFNKWLILLREFILHLETITTAPTMSEKTTSYVLENLKAIHEAQELKKKVINSLQQELLELMQKEETKHIIKTKLEHWVGFPALYFCFEDWNSQSAVVLVLDSRQARNFRINCYVRNLQTQKQKDNVDALLNIDDCCGVFSEQSDTTRGYKSALITLDPLIMGKKLLEKLRLINKIESE